MPIENIDKWSRNFNADAFDKQRKNLEKIRQIFLEESNINDPMVNVLLFAMDGVEYRSQIKEFKAEKIKDMFTEDDPYDDPNDIILDVLLFSGEQTTQPESVSLGGTTQPLESSPYVSTTEDTPWVEEDVSTTEDPFLSEEWSVEDPVLAKYGTEKSEQPKLPKPVFLPSQLAKIQQVKKPAKVIKTGSDSE